MPPPARTATEDDDQLRPPGTQAGTSGWPRRGVLTAQGFASEIVDPASGSSGDRRRGAGIRTG